MYPYLVKCLMSKASSVLDVISTLLGYPILMTS